MVVTCARCNGKMRVDENLIPKGEEVKIRCPHCREIDVFRHGAPSPVPAPATETQPPKPEEPKPQATTLNQKVKTNAGSSRPAEFTIPDDAFRGFRFPSEQGARSTDKQPMNKKLKLAIWLIVSLAVVAFFALLVNIVLPGPQGGAPFYKPAPQEESLPGGPGKPANP
jgi:hypothetical protein